MKKLYTKFFALFILSTTVIDAQPVITGPNFPAFGTTVTNHQVTPTSVTPGNAGANQTWDFSSYPATGATSSGQYVNPSSTPFAATFPTATIATMSGTSGGNTGYGYIFSNSTYSDLIGAGTYSTTGPNIVYTYSNPQRIANYPTNYNSTFTDNMTGFATYVNGGYTINQYRTGTITSTYDGYGTIITPAGTFSNAIRTKLTQSITDSIVIVGFPTSSTSVLQSTSYSWGDANGYSAYYYISYDTSIANSVPSYNKTVMYSTVITGIDDLNQSYKPLAVFPNPVNTNSFIHLHSDELETGITSFVAVDMQGRIVKKIDFLMLPGDHSSFSVDVNEFSPGVYAIRLEQNNRIFVTRFIRQ